MLAIRPVEQVRIPVRCEVVSASPRTAVLVTAYIAVEALIHRPEALGAQVPFACEKRCVAGLRHGFCQGELLQRHAVRVFGWQQRRVALPRFRLVASARADVVGDPKANRVLSREDAGTGRRADRARCIRLREARARGRQAINVRGFVERASIAAEVAPPEVVREEEHDVWGCRRSY